MTHNSWKLRIGEALKHLKKTLIISSLGLLALISILSFIFIYHYFDLNMHIKDSAIYLDVLSREQKIEDFQYLTSVVRDYYPFAELIHKTRGLDDINDRSEDFIQLAADTKDNKEFLTVFLMYLEGLRQAGHGGIYFLPEFSFYTSFAFNLPKDAFLKSDYWKSQISSLDYYVHSPLSVVYENGKYRLTSSYKRGLSEIPIDSLVTAIDDVPVHEYVKALQYRQPLLYDHKNAQVFTTQLFAADLNPEEKYWKVDFLTQDEGVIQAMVLKYPGYQSTNHYQESDQNLVFQELSDTTLYLRIASFEYHHSKNDHETLQSFFQTSNGKYKQLIIDLRGNSGGEITYWSENLLRPLLKEVVTLDVLSAVKKKFERRMSLHLFYYRLFTSNDLLDKSANSIVSIKNTQIEGLDNSDWNCYRIKKEFTPLHSFNFDGEIFILMNRDTLSAADSFVSAMKDLGLATLIGTRTGGWGNHYSQPWVFALPNSGLAFRMDIELAYNADNLPTSIYGTQPHIFLNASEYPGPIPFDYSAESLVKDPWIAFIMKK